MKLNGNGGAMNYEPINFWCFLWFYKGLVGMEVKFIGVKWDFGLISVNMIDRELASHALGDVSWIFHDQFWGAWSVFRQNIYYIVKLK